MSGARLSDDQRVDWLRLIRSENIGPRTFRQLINRYGGARAALEALPELAAKTLRGKTIRIASRDDVLREIDAATKMGVDFVASGEPDYPALACPTAPRCKPAPAIDRESPWDASSDAR